MNNDGIDIFARHLGMAASRRGMARLGSGALAGVAAVAAHAPSLKAKKRKKKRKPPPLAFVLATAAEPQALGGTAFQVTFRAAVTHPASGATDEYSGSFSFAAQASEPATRAQIAAGLRLFAAEVLAGLGEDVPGDRITVSLV
jgi:hypothetical protein